MHQRFLFILLIGFFVSCGYHKPKITVLPEVKTRQGRLLFLAVDGIGYDMISELKKEGYFKDFQDPIPLIVTFPSATTASFTGIFQSLNAGRAPGYEIRFFSYEDNKIRGGTPGDIYKIPIPYKHYFDSFRHTMMEKSLMYSFPGIAGRQDLEHAEDLLYQSRKKVLMAYLGGTDGAQHMLGRHRVKRFMKYVDSFLVRMKKKYAESEEGAQPLHLVLFSDHGFHFDRLKMVSNSQLNKALAQGGYRLSHHLDGRSDVVPVLFGLLSSGVLITDASAKEEVARLIHSVKGLDLTFWPKADRIGILNSQGDEAYFQYRKHGAEYRYVPVHGDPLKLIPLLQKNHQNSSVWLSDKVWFQLTSHHSYPDPGHRLYAAFYKLVKNPGSVLFSTQSNYQFGSFAALAGTYLRLGQKGTHGSFEWEPSAGMAMTDDPHLHLPPAVRYDDFFNLFLSDVTRELRGQAHHHDSD